MTNPHESNGRESRREPSPEQLTAFALGELTGAELVRLRTAMLVLPEPVARQVRAEADATERLGASVREALRSQPLPEPSAELRSAIEQRLAALDVGEAADDAIKAEPAKKPRSFHSSRVAEIVVVALCIGLLVALLLPAVQNSREAARRMHNSNTLKQLHGDYDPPLNADRYDHSAGSASDEKSKTVMIGEILPHNFHDSQSGAPPVGDSSKAAEEWFLKYNSADRAKLGQTRGAGGKGRGQARADIENSYFYDSSNGKYYEGGSAGGIDKRLDSYRLRYRGERPEGWTTGSEQYAAIVENAFIPVRGRDALSTFSIDVDTASYANVRRFLTQGQLPPPDAVRIEELVNYFSYDYPQPKPGEPFSVNMEVAECPWQQQHLLLRVGLKGREIHRRERPISHLVFLLDVSGSMADENKLPLLKQVLSMMVRELHENDRVSIVTYAGDAGLRLPPTTGDQQARVLQAIDSLSAGGSTNGSAGIGLAYEQAQAYFRPEGTNRVILATDGDLNVGITDDESLVRLIKEKAAGGVFLTVLGFGEGNLKDAKMERLADNGNGLYAYIDSVREGHKVLVEQMSGSLVTIAKDVKVQIEFNPTRVQAYRLLGYENRMLAAHEFHDDRRDAGEIGAGHTVTALYELVPTFRTSSSPESPANPPLKYQGGARVWDQDVVADGGSGDLLTLYLRHKEPDGQESELSEYPLANRGGKFQAASRDFQFAAAVASFGMILRNSQYRGDGNLAAVAEIAGGAIGEDKGGYRAEFVDLVRRAQTLGVK